MPLKQCWKKSTAAQGDKLEAVGLLVQEKISVRQACKIVHISRSLILYQKKQKDDSSLIDALHELVGKHPSIGFWKCYYRLRRKGFACNHKRLYRVYTMLRLNVRRRAKRRLPQRIKEPLCLPESVNQSWSMDFLCDSLADGRRFRLLNITKMIITVNHWPLKLTRHCLHSELSEYWKGLSKQEKYQRKLEWTTGRNLLAINWEVFVSSTVLS